MHGRYGARRALCSWKVVRYRDTATTVQCTQHDPSLNSATGWYDGTPDSKQLIHMSSCYIYSRCLQEMHTTEHARCLADRKDGSTIDSSVSNRELVAGYVCDLLPHDDFVSSCAVARYCARLLSPVCNLRKWSSRGLGSEGVCNQHTLICVHHLQIGRALFITVHADMT